MEWKMKLSSANPDWGVPFWMEDISNMYFSHWEPLGVCERWWTKILGWSNLGVDWFDAMAFWWTWDSRLRTFQADWFYAIAYYCIWACWQQTAKHLESLWSCWGIMICFLGPLPVCYEIIVPTYHWTFFHTHLFTLYSHLCFTGYI